METKPETIDQYINEFPPEAKKLLGQIRSLIRKTAPDAEEAISYSIPSFKLNGKYLIYFAGFKNHVGLYPIPKSDKQFQEKLLPYKKGKSTLQFPLNKSLPAGLITKVVKLSIKSNLERMKKQNVKSKK